jgi:predicted ArsR family transcriptional regulator
MDGDCMVNPSRLTDRHRYIALLAASGTLQKKDIAEKAGVHPNTVTRVLKMAEVQMLIGDMRQKLEQQTITTLAEAFDQAAGEAFEKLCDLMRDGPSSVAFRAVESVLDRSAVAPKRQIHTKQDVGGKVMHVHIPARQLRYMHEVMLEAADDPSEVPELPPIENDEEMLVEVDHRGNVLSEKIIKCTDDT